MKKTYSTYWQIVWQQFCKHPLGIAGLIVIFLFILVGIYAPFLASSKPLVVQYQDTWYFPLSRYLFYPDFFTKRLDIFYNLLIFTFPLMLIAWFTLKGHLNIRKWALGAAVFLHFAIFIYLVLYPPRNPASNLESYKQKQEAIRNHVKSSDWKTELSYLNDYERLNMVLHYQLLQNQQNKLKEFESGYMEQSKKGGQNQPVFPTLWNLSHEKMNKERQEWLDQQVKKIKYEVMPLLRPFHWEDDAGGDQGLNRFVSWWDLTRINRKDMVASLIFGVRVSLSVGFLAIGIALLIGIPIGACAGYYGGKLDLFVYRLIEIWESMPTFFMLLMIVAFLQSKSIFLIIAVIGFFGWTGFSRFIRGEFLRQKKMLYVEACHALGYGDNRIIFSHLLPNAIPPLLTLVPFAIMGAITSEAGLSFLGLGEEGSNSWGVLMDEGRSAFPSESYLLWPPAILLTILLVSIALVGDTMRDALDPKLHKT